MDLDGYGAGEQTRTGQFAAARTRAAFGQWDSAESATLEGWLTVRAIEHERPKAPATHCAPDACTARAATATATPPPG